MSDATFSPASTEEILSSIRKIMSAEWEQPASPKLSPLDQEDEDILELTKKVIVSPEKESSRPSLSLPLSVSAPPPSHGNQSAEDLLNALLRPLLKEWLNQHLPSLIEKEIQRRSLS
jgi:hypothetical protein